MDLLSEIDINIKQYLYYLSIILFIFLMFVGMVKLVVWGKKMRKGALLFLAVFPLISIFPIPSQEIKKIERIKQQEIKKEDENGEPVDDEDPDK